MTDTLMLSSKKLNQEPSIDRCYNEKNSFLQSSIEKKIIDFPKNNYVVKRKVTIDREGNLINQKPKKEGSFENSEIHKSPK